LDNDEDEFRDRDYDISAMTNNLAEAFRYGMVENEDIGDVMFIGPLSYHLVLCNCGYFHSIILRFSLTMSK
jgi:hypothetical protein